VRCTQNSGTVPLYQVFELSFTHDGAYENPFFDVTIEVKFESPKGEKVTVGAFFYGSSTPPVIRRERQGRGRAQTEYVFEKLDLWKARFAPTEVGPWRYSYRFTNVKGGEASGTGTFACVNGRSHNPGFVRPHPSNPYRWVCDDGTAYFPVGLQTGWADRGATGTFLDGSGMEGPFRLDRSNPLPPGPLYVRGPSSNPQNADVYFRHYGRCGFNLLRFSQRNNTPDLYRDLDHYLVQEAVMTDELLAEARRYGFRVMYGLFGYQKAFTEEPDNAEGMAKVKRFVKYSVDRWGVYVDFWEFLNEQKADARWYDVMTPYLKSIDPYHHPITTS
jgi:hypothetical protein